MAQVPSPQQKQAMLAQLQKLSGQQQPGGGPADGSQLPNKRRAVSRDQILMQANQKMAMANQLRAANAAMNQNPYSGGY